MYPARSYSPLGGQLPLRSLSPPSFRPLSNCAFYPALASTAPLHTVSSHPLEIVRPIASSLVQPTTLVGRPATSRLPLNGLGTFVSSPAASLYSRYVPSKADSHIASLPGRVREFGKYLPEDVRILVEDSEQVKADFRKKIDADCDDVASD